MDFFLVKGVEISDARIGVDAERRTFLHGECGGCCGSKCNIFYATFDALVPRFPIQL